MATKHKTHSVRLEEWMNTTAAAKKNARLDRTLKTGCSKS